MIDTHCHLSKNDYDNVEEVIKRMENNIMIASGAEVESNHEIIELVKNYDNIYGTIGIHPNECKSLTIDHLNWLEENIINPKIVGIGEIGLDYHYGKEEKDLQKEVFIKQILLAKKYHKPVVIHSRDAMEDTLEIIKEYLNGYPTVMHCYSGSLESAKELTKMGVYLGIGGVLTFKNANKLVEVVKNIDIKYLLLETDSPYLAPVPFRGEKNEPSYVRYVALKLAELKEMSYEEVVKITTENAARLFDIKY